MPTYEYVCKSCGHELEVFQSMTEAPKRKCPECGKNALERKIGTGAAVLFKGSGFYQTDYRSESYKKAAESEGKPAGEGAKDGVKAGAGQGEAKKGDAAKSQPKKPEPAKPAPKSKKKDADAA
jgi:putative FmdB family regulatory protein